MLPIVEQVRGNSPVWKVVKLRFLNDAHSQLSGHLNRDLWRPLTQTFKMQFFFLPRRSKAAPTSPRETFLSIRRICPKPGLPDRAF
jgi:hypothetical protein